MTCAVPLANPRRDLLRYEADIIEATRRVIDSGAYIGGPETHEFERELARQVGTQAAVGVGSGTDALIFAMQAGGVTRGDEVIVPSHTAGPSVAAIHALAAIPVFVDVAYDTACIDTWCLEEAIGPRTRAILAVHLYGHPARLDVLSQVARANGLILIEDCAQAQGATHATVPVGSVGQFGCFSFYPTKNLGALGDGGAVTGDAAGVALVRKLRTYGWDEPQYSEIPFGRCSRLDELQAAFLNIRFRGLADDLASRRRIAAIYQDRLSDLPFVLPVEQHDCTHSYHLFVIKSDRRDALREHLAKSGVMSGLHYPYPAHLQPGLSANARISGSLDVTMRLQKEILSLPIFAAMTDEEIETVADRVRDFFTGKPAA